MQLGCGERAILEMATSDGVHGRGGCSFGPAEAARRAAAPVFCVIRAGRRSGSPKNFCATEHVRAKRARLRRARSRQSKPEGRQQQPRNAHEQLLAGNAAFTKRSEQDGNGANLVMSRRDTPKRRDGTERRTARYNPTLRRAVLRHFRQKISEKPMAKRALSASVPTRGGNDRGPQQSRSFLN